METRRNDRIARLVSLVRENREGETFRPRQGIANMIMGPYRDPLPDLGKRSGGLGHAHTRPDPVKRSGYDKIAAIIVAEEFPDALRYAVRYNDGSSRGTVKGTVSRVIVECELRSGNHEVSEYMFDNAKDLLLYPERDPLVVYMPHISRYLAESIITDPRYVFARNRSGWTTAMSVAETKYFAVTMSMLGMYPHLTRSPKLRRALTASLEYNGVEAEGEDRAAFARLRERTESWSVRNR